MSYSFTIRAASKTEAKDKADVEFDRVRYAQPPHAVDIPAAKVTAAAFIDMLEDDSNRDVMVTVNGSVTWQSATEPFIYTGTAVSVSAYLATKE